ncbi:MAG: RNB domain-containing ribonuclease [Candidatus Micrarchaeia archaeon]
MVRFNKVRPRGKARSRSGARAPGKPGDSAGAEPKRRANPKFAERARKRAIREAEENARRMPELNLQMIAQDAMGKYGFEHKLSLVVNAKANAHDEFFIKKIGAALRDLRHLPWSSINSYYSRSLDQMECCERGQGGEILVKVAIADVDAFAPKGSVLDAHAETNATSVYPGKESFPMLPEQLSSDLSAFPMDCDRLAIVVEFAVLPRGNVRFGKICRAYVRNHAQLTLGEAGALIEGRETPEIFEEMPELAGQILLQDEASLRLSKFRAGEAEARDAAAGSRAQGAMGAGEEDRTLGLCVVETDRAKMIIGNFMACANRAMNGCLEDAHVPAIRRVVAIPKEWEGIAEIADAKGFALPPEPDARALSEFLAKEKEAGPGGFSGLSGEIAKLLGPGEYAMLDGREQVEYFCIAEGDCLVGMSPNQKYMDLVVQRLLKAAIAHIATPYSKSELVEIAAWCSERENAAKKVERTVQYEGAALKP